MAQRYSTAFGTLRAGTNMKSLQILAFVGACLIGSVASSRPPATAVSFPITLAPPVIGGAVPCLAGTKKCTELSETPSRACFVSVNGLKSCPIDGFKSTPAILR